MSDGVGPYEINQVYYSDALAFLKALPAECADVLLTDPPYCSGGWTEAQRQSATAQGVRSQDQQRPGFFWFTNDNMTTTGLTWLMREMLLETHRILKPNRSAFVFTDWRMVPHLAPALESSGLRYRSMIIWDKGAIGLGVGFRATYEVIMEFSKGRTDYQRVNGSNVIRAGRVPNNARHHTVEKPLPLLTELLSVAAPAGGLVVDPFAGSGSTGVAAIEAGYRFVGCDLDRRMLAIARDRLKAARPPLLVEREGAVQLSLMEQ